MESKKICLITPSLQMGGIERAMSTLANYFASKGFEIHLVTLFPFEPFFKLDERIHLYFPPYKLESVQDGIKQYSISFYWNILSPFNGYAQKTITQIKPDVVMAFGDWFPHLIMLGLRNKYPFYYCNRSNPNIKYSKTKEFIRRLAYQYTPPAGIIAQTSQAAERKRRLIHDKCPIRIIPNPARKIEFKDIEKQNWIISVGRLHMEKGFVRLMEAFQNLDAPDWKLVLVGGGVHEKEIKQKAIDLGIEHRVVFTGKSNQVDKYLCQSRIFVLSSYQEGFPNALCEGMAAGLACISFDIVAGPRDIIENNKNGYLIPDNDIEGLTEKMQYLIENPETRTRLGVEAKKITEHLSINKIGDMFLDFILKQN